MSYGSLFGVGGEMIDLGKHPPVENVWAELARLCVEVERLQEVINTLRELREYDCKEIERLRAARLACLIGLSSVELANAQFGPLDETVMKQAAEIERLRGQRESSDRVIRAQHDEIDRLRAEIERLRTMEEKK